MKKYLSLLSIFLICALLIPHNLAFGIDRTSNTCAKQEENRISTTSNGQIVRLYTDKACYTPNSTVILTTEIKNDTSQKIFQTIKTVIYHLDEQVWEKSENVTVEANSTKSHNVSWQCGPEDFKGYLAQMTLSNGSTKVTAIDVSSDISRYPRYGFSVDFPQGETKEQSTEIMKELAEDYHINIVQYYDWMWRHEKVIPSDTASSWKDMFENTISKNSILQRINAGHDLNQKAMAYQMAYMAREDYQNYGVNKEWGLFKNHNNNINYDPDELSTINNIDQFIFPLEGKPAPILFVFNPLNQQWRNFMANQYVEAVNKLGFDGIQIDQMGDFWGNVDYYDYSGNKIDLANSFSTYVNDIKEKLTENNSRKNLVTMNAVNGAVYPNDRFSSRDIIKNSNTDFQFSEIWQHCSNYNDLKNYIDWQRKNDGGKTMVCAAYMNQYDNIGTSYQAENGSLNGVHSGSENGVTFITGFDEVGDNASYAVQVPEDGTYSLVFLASNGTDTRSSKNIYIDGNKKMTAYFDSTREGLIPAQPSWYVYSTESSFTSPKELYLTKGSHKIKIQQDSENQGGDIRLDSISLGTYDANSVRITDAVLASCGAMHIEMGSGLTTANSNSKYSESVMLGHPYYPKAFKSMRNDLRTAIKNHYNFITAYENLLYDKDIVPSDGGLQNISIQNQPISGCGEPGKIWFIPKNKGNEYGILNLINMTSESDTDWRNPTYQPQEKNYLRVKYYIPTYKSVESVHIASPDINSGLSAELNYSVYKDQNGKYVSFTIPSLKYWDMVYLKWGSETSSSIIEAESSILSNVSTNNNHPGYTGNGFVDSYGELYSSVTFDIDVPSDGYYNLKFRYSNATDNECKRTLIMDNISEGEVNFPVTPNWNTWEESEKKVYIRKGMHRLVLLVANNSDGYINLDNIKVDT